MEMKMTYSGRQSTMEDNLKISNFEYLSNHWSDLPKILNLSSGEETQIKNTWNEDNLQWKTTSKGRRPQNIKSWISQQQMIGSSSNVRPKLRGRNPNEKYLKWRRPPMEGDLQWKTSLKY